MSQYSTMLRWYLQRCQRVLSRRTVGPGTFILRCVVRCTLCQEQLLVAAWAKPALLNAATQLPEEPNYGQMLPLPGDTEFDPANVAAIATSRARPCSLRPGPCHYGIGPSDKPLRWVNFALYVPQYLWAVQPLYPWPPAAVREVIGAF